MELLAQLVTYFAQHGYLAVLFALLICSIGVPLPEDITLVSGGVIAGLGFANVHLMLLVALTGVLAGDLMMFTIGRIFGPRVLNYWPIKQLVTPARYAQVQQKFDQYGNRVLFTSRFLPGMRAAVFLTAGLTRRISVWRFLLFDGMAALISVPIWVYLGYFGANNDEWLSKWLSRGQVGISTLLISVVIMLLGYWLWRRAKRKAVHKLNASASVDKS